MKSIDVVIKKTAQDLGLPESKVKVVVMEYWKTIYYKILKGEGTTITARHIGTFTVSRYKLYIYIRKIIKKIRGVKKSKNISEEKRTLVLDSEYKKLRNCLYHRNIIAKNYAEQFGNI